MPPRFASALTFACLAGLLAPLAAQEAGPAAGSELADYVRKPEAAYQWKLESKKKNSADEIATLHLVSQVWQGETWEHNLQLYTPAGVEPTKTLLLWNTGGEPKAADILMGMSLARLAKAPVAFLYGVPKQPLFGGKKEDALIAETYVRFLETKDPSWPLLFPMAKSVVKAMDALQAYTKEAWPAPVEKFVIAGASKRGWTTWLAAASGDPRVKAIAPVVIDTLNMQKQLPHQLEMFGGKYSEQIHDYVERGLAPFPNTPEAKKLAMMVDPWFYRAKLTLPKLILNGANDPYWTVDALNNYWDGLEGPKWVAYVPNAGHNLEEKLPDGKKSRLRALNTLAAFYRHQVTDQPLPKLECILTEADGEKKTSLKCDQPLKKVNFWSAENGNLDFRPALWRLTGATSSERGGPNHTLSYCVNPRDKDYVAFFMEAEFEIDGIPYSLCTPIQVQGPRKK